MGAYNQQSGGGVTGILNKCKEINDGVSDLRTKREGQLSAAQNALLDSSTDKEDQHSRQTLDYIEDEINNGFRYLRDLLKRMKQTPGSGDARAQKQIDVTSRNLQREIEQYQRAQSDFQKRLREQVRRRYEIANPEATAADIDQGVENVLMGQEQSFQVRTSLKFQMTTYLWIGTDYYRSLVRAAGKPTTPDVPPSNDPVRFGRLSRI